MTEFQKEYVRSLRLIAWTAVIVLLPLCVMFPDLTWMVLWWIPWLCSHRMTLTS